MFVLSLFFPGDWGLLAARDPGSLYFSADDWHR